MSARCFPTLLMMLSKWDFTDSPTNQAPKAPSNLTDTSIIPRRESQIESFNMDQNGCSNKGKEVARPRSLDTDRPRSWREQDDRALMRAALQNVAVTGPAPDSNAPDSQFAVPVASGGLVDQKPTAQNPLALNAPASNEYGPSAIAQRASAQSGPAQHPSDQPAPALHASGKPAAVQEESAQHSGHPKGRAGSHASALSSDSNPPQPIYSLEETVPVSYLVFLDTSPAEANEPEFRQFEVKAPITSRTSRGAPPVGFRAAKPGSVPEDLKKFFTHLVHYNKILFEQQDRNCIRCQNPTQTFYPQFKALYQFHKLQGGVDPERDGIFRPMCRIIPVCEGNCLEAVKKSNGSQEMQNDFLDIFGKFHEFRHGNPGTDFVIFEVPRKHSKQFLTWCGVCRERWYVSEPSWYIVRD